MAKNNKTNHLSPRLAKDYEGVYHAHGQQPLTSSIPIIAHGYLTMTYLTRKGCDEMLWLFKCFLKTVPTE